MRVQYEEHKGKATIVKIQTGRTSVALIPEDASYSTAYALAQDFGLFELHVAYFGNGFPVREIHDVVAPVVL